MFFRKKEIPGEENLRRRFHHSLLARKRGDNLSKTVLPSHGRRSLFRKPTSALSIVAKKIFIVGSISLIAIGTFYLVFFSSFFTITKASLVKDGTAIESTALSPFLDKLKGKNLLFVDLDALAREIEQTFQHEVKSVRVRKSPPSTLVVHVEEYPAMLNVEVTTEDNQTQKIIVNSLGYIIAGDTEQKSLPILHIKISKALEDKTALISEDWIKQIQDAYQKFPEMFGMKIISGEWKKTERELHLKTEKNFVIWLDLTADIPTQLAKLKRALTKLDIYNEPLEYIDLRIPGGDSEKVIFKRRK